MKKIFNLFFLLVGSFVFAQSNYIHQVLLLNEGQYSNNEVVHPVTVGVYSPSDNTYNTIIEIDDVRFASDLVLDGNCFYVAADNKILKYDLDTYELIGTVDIQGVRKLVVDGDYLFASRGDYDPITFSAVIFDSYLEVFSKTDLNYLFSFDVTNGPAWSTENLLINEDKLYVLINNAYDWGNYKGLIGVVDLLNMTYLEELDLGEDGKNPINMMFKNNTIYTLNNKNWDGSSVSILDLNMTNIETVNLSDVSAGCGVSLIRESKLNYQKTGDTQMSIFDLETQSTSGYENNLNQNYYAISEDPVNNYLYAAVSSFTSDSEVIIYGFDNVVYNSFFADVATSAIVFDVRNNNISSVGNHIAQSHQIIQTIDVLGRFVTKDHGLTIEVFDNGSYNKKFLIK